MVSCLFCVVSFQTKQETTFNEIVSGCVDVAVDDQTAAGAVMHPHAQVLLHDTSASRAYLRRSSRIHQCDPAASACSHLRDPGAYPPYGGVVVLVRHPPRTGPGPQLFHAEVLHGDPVDRVGSDGLSHRLPSHTTVRAGRHTAVGPPFLNRFPIVHEEEHALFLQP